MEFLARLAKKAGIAGMRYGYPDDKSQRGCEYWSRFSTAARAEYEVLFQSAYKQAQERSAAEAEIVRTQRQLIAAMRTIDKLLAKDNLPCDDVLVTPPPPTS